MQKELLKNYEHQWEESILKEYLEWIKKKVNKENMTAFVSGLLIMFIVCIPFAIQPTFAYVKGEVLYSEDAVVYNQVYNEVFDSLGEAGENSFLLLETFNITDGYGVGIELSYNAVSVDVERLVFYKKENDIIFRKLVTNNVSSPYTEIIEIDGGGLYGIALFCTCINNSEPVLISMSVMVIKV
jgi:hypothetical protein